MSDALDFSEMIETICSQGCELKGTVAALNQQAEKDAERIYTLENACFILIRLLDKLNDMEVLDGGGSVLDVLDITDTLEELKERVGVERDEH